MYHEQAQTQDAKVYTGCGINEARARATAETGGAHLLATQPQLTAPAVGEVPKLVGAIQDAMLRLDREFSILTAKMEPVLSDVNRANGDTKDAEGQQVFSPMGVELTKVLRHINDMSNAIVGVRDRTKL